LPHKGSYYETGCMYRAAITQMHTKCKISVSVFVLYSWVVPLAIGLGGVATIVAAPVVIAAAGFTSGGIVAGSVAASMMSSAAVGSTTGGVVAGSLVATLQAVGATGSLAAAGGTGTAAVGGIGASVGAGLGWLANKFAGGKNGGDDGKNAGDGGGDGGGGGQSVHGGGKSVDSGGQSANSSGESGRGNLQARSGSAHTPVEHDDFDSDIEDMNQKTICIRKQ
jgi:hypothetical protein